MIFLVSFHMDFFSESGTQSDHLIWKYIYFLSLQVCSISSKVHTTRCKARAIGIHGSTQLVFLDTPGLVNSDELHR